MPGRKKKYTAQRLAKRPHRITPSKLAEAMPDVVAALEGGNEEETYRASAKVASCMMGTRNAKALTRDGVTMDRLDFQMMALATLVVTGSSPEESKLKEILQESMLLNYCLCTLSEDSEAKDISILAALEAKKLILQGSFDKVVDEHKDAIVAICFEGDTKKFVAQCKAYHATTEEFYLRFYEASVELEDYETSGLNDQFQKQASACTGVMFGMHKSSWICWQCGEEADNCCSKCRSAKYCSKECQSLNWKNGHRAKCGAIKPVFATFDAVLTTIDKAFENPEAHAQKVGVGPAIADLHLARLASMYVLHKEGISVQEEGIETLAMIEGFLDHRCPWTKGFDNSPRMANFYKNVRRVVENGFLLSPTPTSKPIAPKQCDRDEDNFTTIARALMFDYSRLPREAALAVLHGFTGQDEGPSLDLKPQEWLFNYCDGERYTEEGPACKKLYQEYLRHELELHFNELLRTNHSGLQAQRGDSE